jgi:trypsin
MIVVLDNEVSNPAVGIVGLAGSNTPLNPGDSLTVIGFGATSEGGNGSDVLQEVDVPYVSDSDCRGVYGSGFESDVMFCAGFTSGGRDSCQGDSGG